MMAATSTGSAVTITGDSSYIRNNTPGANYGGDQPMIMGTTTAPAIIRGVMTFSLSSIPAGSTITSITLRLTDRNNDTSSENASFQIDLHTLNASFAEGNGDGSGSGVSGVSWTKRSDTLNWTTPGGDFSPTILSSISANPVTTTTGTNYTFTSNTNFVAAAQSALNGGSALNLLLKLNVENTAFRRAFFFESDNGAAGGVPTLTVEYIPEPSALLLSAIGAFGLLRRRR